MNSKNKEQWYELFSDNYMLTDDGNPHDFNKWWEMELFGSSLAYLYSADKVENGGLTLYGKFHSDKWGDFNHYSFGYSVSSWYLQSIINNARRISS
jgi:hypothetical protein